MTIPTRLLIVSSASNYQGMDRPVLGVKDDIPDEFILRDIELQGMSPMDAEAGFNTLISDLEICGFHGYDVLALGAMPGPNWVFLGFDVGETTNRAWSAIAHRTDLGLSAQGLNDFGLFNDRSVAQAFLQAYLATNDPDRRWGADGAINDTDLYAIIPVYRMKTVRNKK